jgi:hypothetical protein
MQPEEYRISAFHFEDINFIVLRFWKGDSGRRSHNGGILNAYGPLNTLYTSLACNVRLAFMNINLLYNGALSDH